MAGVRGPGLIGFLQQKAGSDDTFRSMSTLSTPRKSKPGRCEALPVLQFERLQLMRQAHIGERHMNDTLNYMVRVRMNKKQHGILEELVRERLKVSDEEDIPDMEALQKALRNYRYD